MTSQKHTTEWHPFPKTKPKKSGEYFVTSFSGKRKKTSKPRVRVDIYDVNEGDFMWGGLENVLAWAELPPPYEPPEKLDMHPDAVFARKYAEGDPDTVAAAHIFD